MKNRDQYIIRNDITIRNALERINQLGDPDAVLFVIDHEGVLKGSLTDGDIRRGLLSDVGLNEPVEQIVNTHFHRVNEGKIDDQYIKECLKKNIYVLPNLDASGKITGFIDLHNYHKELPVHAVIMAGGRGERLMPLTRDLPKPMLAVGKKPIIEHNIDRLIKFGISDIHISINYLGEKISSYFGDGSAKNCRISYIQEEMPLGTLGSVVLASDYRHEHLLVMNSDLLTNIDFSDFYNEFISRGADMAVATIPYHVDLPYAIMEIDTDTVVSLREKPRYTYFANAGIYLLKKECLSLVPQNTFYNATDLMDALIKENKKLINYPILGYWLDIGKHEDFTKAQTDIQHLNL